MCRSNTTDTIGLHTTLSRDEWSLFNILVATVTSLFFIALAKFHWNRRRLYYFASKHKGPMSLPMIGCGYLFLGSTANSYDSIKMLFSEYGNGFAGWFGYKLFVGVCDPEDAGTLLNSPKALGKASVYEAAKKGFGTGLFTAPVDIWKVHRKLISPSFNSIVLNSFVEVFAERSAILNEKLKTVAGNGHFDVLNFLTNYYVDVLCKTSLGCQNDAQEANSEFKENFSTITESGILRIFRIFYHFDFIYNRTDCCRREENAIKFLHTFVDKVIADRISLYEEKRKENAKCLDVFDTNKRKWKPLLDCLIESSYKDGKLTADDLRDEVNTFMVAGTDTAASSSSLILLLLAIYEDVQEKVYEEVMSIVGPDRDVEASDLLRMEYLERVIKESLRLFPVGIVIARYVEEDIKLKSFTIPAGCTAFIGIESMHKNAKYWPDPERFDPDRFLPEEVKKQHVNAYMPFSAGPRNCIGVKYAMMVMKTTIASVVRKYKIYTSYKTIGEIKLHARIVLVPCDGYKLSIEAR